MATDMTAERNPPAAADRVYDPLDPVVKQEPYPYYARMRRDQPVAWLPSMKAWGVFGYDEIDALLMDAKTFSSQQFWSALLGEYDPVPEVPPMIALDPPEHLPLRKFANKAFVPSRIAKLKDRTYEVANALIDDIIAKHGAEGEFDWVWEFTSLYPVTVIAEVLGVPTQRRAEFKVWVDDILAASSRDAYGPDRLAQIADSSVKIRKFFEDLYDERANNLGEDLISAFMTAEIGGKHLSRVEVIQMAILLLIGGVETTTNLLGTTLVELHRHPQVYQRVRGNPELIPNLIEEVLRYNTPVQMIFRHTTTETELGGIAIPKDSLVMPMLGSANRDETKFTNPDEFDIDRDFEVRVLSFGQGPHYCLGTYLTRMEARSALELAFQRFAVLQPVSDEVERLDSYFARGPHYLKVRYKVA